MAYVRDSITWATFESYLRAYLGILAPEDAVTLEAQLDAATAEADRFLANPFVDDAGVDIPIPDAVQLGLAAWVGTLRKVTGNAVGAAPAGVASVKTGDNAVSYAGGIGLTGTTSPTALALEAARPYWQYWRKKVWR